MEDRLEMWRTIRRAITLLGILAGGYLLVILPIERAMSKTTSRIERGVQRVLGAITNTDTRIVEGRAEIVETAEISELSLLEMKMNATRTIEKSEKFQGLSLGTKKLIVRGHYRVKAGYRLQGGISLRMANGAAVAEFPRAEVLSVELLDYDVLNEDSGWLNRVQPDDREQILRELRNQMRAEAEASGMLGTVEATLRTRLRDLLGVESVTLESTLP